ncbi:MAG TPA: NAD-dependent epimerase/dehydratase family protein [Pirellulales bacterium]|nr:NAD-dependent epimerase/dehydratase family protein [Pirellulales bacterium]
MARVLVTGASGFIGQQLVGALLARGDGVRCLVRSTSPAGPLQQLGAELIPGDVTQPDTLSAAMNGLDVVYHLAGLTKAIGLAAYCRVNESGVRHVVEACARRTTPPVIVQVSSLAAAGPMTDRERLRTEDDLPRPVSHYGLSKRAGELAAEKLANRAPITVVRPPIVLGPGDRTGLALFRSIRRFRSFLVLGVGRRVSVVHVTDLVNGLIAAAERGERLRAPSPTNDVEEIAHPSGTALSNSGRGYYFLAADEHPLFAELGRMIARTVNRPYAWAIHLPMPSIWLVAGGGELLGRITRRPRYLNLDRGRELSAGHWICSPEKARRDLGFVPGASLTARIEQTTQWYREHGWLS